MTFLRSLLFLAFQAAWTPLVVTSLLLLFWLPIRQRRRFVMLWVVPVSWLIKHLLAIDYQVLGAENIPARPCVVLCKHQSAWETIVLQRIFDLPSFVYKKELHWLPFFGWGLFLMPFVGIDRGAGKEALNQVATRGKQRLDEGYPVIVFPEGTRVAPGQKKRYKVGGAYLAVKAGALALPVAHNAGEFWRRNAFIKQPGRITVSIGPAIDAGQLTPEELNQRVEAWIEAEMARISPRLYPHEAAPPPAHAAV